MTEVNEDLKKGLLKHLADLHTAFRMQHNHKETSAWAGIVIFLLICVQLAKFGKSSDFYIHAGATIFFIVFGLLVWCFVKKQYELQLHALKANAACMSLSAKILSGEKEVSKNDCEPAPGNAKLKELKNWNVFPKCLLEEINIMPTNHLKDRLYLEKLGYWVLIVTMLFVLYSIWSNEFKNIIDCITSRVGWVE